MQRALTVPAGHTFRLSDLSLITRRANTNTQPCIVEIWRGTEAAPTAQAWSRIKISSDNTYDRSWQMPLTFAAGEAVWVKAFFDPFNLGLRICMRADPNAPAEVGYALRGYLLPSHAR